MATGVRLDADAMLAFLNLLASSLASAAIGLGNIKSDDTA